MQSSFIRYFLALFCVSMLFSCARRGSPTGGPIDSLPPILIEADPAIETVNFKEKKIKIYFDEYIKLKNPNQNLVISPPPKNEPILTPVGTASKFITIKILDTLDPNTTYSFNFGNSIVDNNEENELENFNYVFSTGPYIDSLFIKGEVTDPTVSESAKDLDIMLYEYNENYTDSIIFKEKPRYIANTLDSTLYELSNLKAGKYLLIALKDVNNNKVFNPDVDKIGFIEDTVVLPTDKVYNFTIFKEIPELQMVRPKEIKMGRYEIGYYGDVSDMDIKITTPVPDNFKYIINKEVGKDTLNYWHTPFEADSLVFEFSKNKYQESFTVKPRLKEIDSLKVTNSVSGIIHYLDTFHFKTNTPIISFDPEKIQIIKDSMPVDFTSTLSDSKNKLYLHFDKDWESEYQITASPNMITDLFGLSNDSIEVNLKTKLAEDYATLRLDVKSNENAGFIVQLLDTKETIVRSTILDEPGRVSFNWLNPGNYMVRVIIDENRNGIWDTGSFLNRRQAEKIRYYDEPIELNGNWDVLNDFFVDR